jgi:hypothetical protein
MIFFDMFKITSVTDRDVTDKIDLDYIRSFAEGKPEFEHTALVEVIGLKRIRRV